MIKSNLTKLIFSILALVSSISVGQSISGKVVDEAKKPLEFASIAVLNAADSTLVSYASTDIKGNFKVVDISDGKRIFQINLIGYKVYQKGLDFAGKSLEFGAITLKEKDNTLDEVNITAVIPITIKKDTMAFNTKAFKVRVDDNVEDLLKKLPGVEVDADGKVKAQGEDVTKVYVDGKEFFGGDPAVAMKNLSADAIKKVEVIDEKSDKARVSGVNDSDRAKVINLVLKDDKKVNDFGKFQGGYGSDNRYLTSVSYNRFSPKIQASVIGKYNNVNTTGSDISDIMSFGGGSGGFSIRRGGSGGSSSGFITTGIGGFNLGYELKKKQNLNTDYFYNYNNTESGNVSTKRTEFIGTDRLYSESNSNSNSTTKSHKANFSFIDRSDKLQSITLRGNLRSSNTDGSSTSSVKFSEINTIDVDDIENTNNSNSNNDSNSGRLSLDYNKRFNAKSKRSIEVELDVDFSKSTSLSGNSATKTYADLSRPDEVTSGTKNQNDKDNEIDIEIQYTEPINDKNFVEFGAGITVANKDEYTDQTTTGSTFKADLFEDRKTTYGSVDYRFNNKKTSLTIGTQFQEQSQDFGDILNIDLANRNINKKYSSVNPSFRFRYRPKKGSWVFFRYRKSLDLPSLGRLSPVVNDFNPLYIRKGNKDLTPETRHSLFGMYGNYNFVTGFSFFAHLSYNKTSDAIVNSEDTDIARVRTSSYVNLGNRDSFSGDLSFGNRLKKLGIRYNLGLNYATSNYQSVINSVNNKTNSKNTRVRVSFENNKKDFLDLAVGANFNKNITSFSGATEDRDYFQQSYFVKSDWNVTKSFNVTTQFKYDIYTDSNFGTDQAVPIWNASISYAFLQSKAMNIKLTALDMLNKNIGFARSGSDNYFQETTRDVLGTYYMLSLTYTLNGNKGPKGSNRRRGRRMRR